MSAIEWVLLGNEAVKAGDLVSADAGGMPIYRVVAVEGGQAWLEGDRAVRKMPLARFRWKAAAVTNPRN
jgi:hypothetical protein